MGDMKASFCSIAYRNRKDVGILQIMREVRAAGYDGVEILWPHVQGKSDAELAEVKAAAAELGLTIPMLSPHLGNFNLPMTNYDEMIGRCRAAAPVAAKLGAPLLRAFVGWTCECSSLTADEAYWRFNLKGFREMAAIAAGHGLAIAMETHGRTLADSVAGIRRLVEQGDSRLRVNFQLDDLAANSGLPDGVAVYEAIRDLVVHMHMHPVFSSAADQREHEQILAAMERDGFGGYVSIEHCSADGDPREIAVRGIGLLADMGVRDGELAVAR